jgi:hypothetical protein
LEKLGFPWILSSEMSLFNGLCEILRKENFSRPSLALSGAGRAPALALADAEGGFDHGNELSLVSAFPQQIVEARLHFG